MAREGAATIRAMSLPERVLTALHSKATAAADFYGVPMVDDDHWLKNQSNLALVIFQRFKSCSEA